MKFTVCEEMKKTPGLMNTPGSFYSLYSFYNCGPADTSAFPASFPSYFAKFLMNLPARSFAFSSHSEASA